MDTVMLPTITQRFVDQLRQGGVTLAHIELPCGHHTMGAFPFNLMALGSLSRTLSQV
jgi:hypothetical protein